MNYEMIRHIFLYATLINYAILLLWFFIFVFARDFLKHIHSIWFKLPDRTFDTLNYAGIAFYKISIIMFNLVPLIAISLAGKV